ncbi:MAG: dipicolinate synthase subunit B [Clostridia bacterium]
MAENSKEDKINIGLAICGSFCTFSTILKETELLIQKGFHITPILSPASKNTDTRFGKAIDFCDSIEKITGEKIIDTIEKAEPIGPKKPFDILIVAPCTGNTLAKLALGITDTSVTMAVKAHIRNARPVLIAVSTNDALSNSAKNIAMLLNYKNIYFVPMRQDDYIKKPNSLVADFTKIEKSLKEALNGKQIEPVFLDNLF